ncbi:MAG: patatin-like phospholipase family protein [Gammaproteobacteria bacterium]|nr:patatin-like phospholipase family protein [Gammaproteobacteria bacterium]MDH3767145.1 patatin-like phospholipase family protein [Gammaproteobacteria bacterium]
MNSRFLSHIAVLLSLCLLSITTLAADGRPKIGLVLSGGGARGAAHVGVIKVLEELRVPVDVIAGTSMGAVIGGLYAMGYDAEELSDLIAAIDWTDHFVDDPKRSALSFRRKQDDRDFLIDFDMGLGPDGVELPRGLVQGQKLNLLLKSWTLPVEHIDDFDQLHIPFRAVATDVENGLPVVLGDGDLATAIRASMAVPGAFAPVDYQGRLLIDGGVSNNLPIDVARSLGADVLIVVDIQFPLLSRDELRSALDITGQLLTILVIRESNSQLATLDDDDIVIVPDLGKMGSTEFTLAPQAVGVGERSARARTTALADLGVSETEYAVYASRRQTLHQSPAIDYVRVTGSDSITRDVLRAQLDMDAGPLDLKRLEEGITRLYGLDTFELVDYAIENDSERTGLAITATDKSWGPDYLNLGARLADDLEGTSRYTVGLRYTRTAVNRRGAEWRNDLQVGTNPRLFSEFYQPLDKRWRYFVAPQIDLQRFEADLFDGSERLAALQISSATGGVDLGRTFGNWGELRVGLRRTSGRISRRVGEIQPQPDSFESGSLIFSFGRDSLDNANFPRSGWRADLGWDGFRSGLGSSHNRDRLLASSLWASSSGRRTWLVSALAGSNLRGDGEVQDLFDLGGLFRLSGFRNGQLRGQHHALLGLAHYQRINTSSSFDIPVYAGASLELGNVWNDSSDIAASNALLAGSLFLGIDTFVGPIYLAFGLTEDGHSAAYFLLGQGFE